MTRPGRAPRAPSAAARFATDAPGFVLGLLASAGAGLTAADIKRAAQAAGVGKADIDQAWPRIQRRVKADPRVAADGARYRWVGEPVEATAPEPTALEATAPEPAAPEPAAPEPAATDRVQAARDRQAAIDSVRALAELAMEIEELALNDASSAALVHRVRSRVGRNNLQPIGRTGEKTTFDRQRHMPVGRPIADGTAVVIVRPGYVWQSPDEIVLIARAVVQE